MREFKSLRQAQDFNQKTDDDMAKLIKKSTSSYIKKRRGKVKFENDEIIIIAKAFGLSLQEVNIIFFNGDLPNGNS